MMLKDFIYDKKFKILLIDNNISLLNYIDIISFSDNNIIIKCPNYILEIIGNNLIITKMIDTELNIKGHIDSLKFK